jgi:predicted RNA-binding Zn ribbon-like protein
MSDAETTLPDPARVESDGYRFGLDAGHLALDFANTISRREAPDESRDRLTDYGRLVSWGREAELLSDEDETRLRAEAADRPRAAVAALRRAVALREATFDLFVALARGERTPEAALAALNAALPAALAALRLRPDGGGFTWSFAHGEADLAPILAPVVRAAAELLTSADLARIRECGSDTCFWLFLDRSKNGTRRWCDMKVCGNRAKARRHYHREKKSSRRVRPS